MIKLSLIKSIPSQRNGVRCTINQVNIAGDTDSIQLLYHEMFMAFMVNKRDCDPGREPFDWYYGNNLLKRNRGLQFNAICSGKELMLLKLRFHECE